METETSSGPPIPELLFQCHTAAGTLGSKDEEQLGFIAAKADHKSCTSSAAVACGQECSLCRVVRTVSACFHLWITVTQFNITVRVNQN